MFCTKCGQEIQDGANFCTGCGKPVKQKAEKDASDFFSQIFNTAGQKAAEAVKVVENKRKDVAAVVGEKTKEIAVAVGEKAKETTKEIGKKINDTITDSKARIELMKAAKKATEENKSDQDKVKDQVKLDQALKDALDSYNQEYTKLSNYGMELYIQRERAADLIINIEDLINSIANHPKSFDADIQEIETQRLEFKGVSDYAREELDAAKKTATGAGAGVAVGTAVASLAPTAAMWIATTFGTASTGTAISALSGAAATKAALAWLGGGAVVAGGGGTAAGSAFLAMCGPVGWGIAGATLLTSVVLFAANQVKMNKQKKEEVEAVMRNTTALKETNVKVGVILDETNTLRDSLSEMYRKAMIYYNGNFVSLTDEEKIRLGTLVNNTKSLAATLSKTV